jgi:hypothetical protein
MWVLILILFVSCEHQLRVFILFYFPDYADINGPKSLSLKGSGELLPLKIRTSYAFREAWTLQPSCSALHFASEETDTQRREETSVRSLAGFVHCCLSLSRGSLLPVSESHTFVGPAAVSQL